MTSDTISQSMLAALYLFLIIVTGGSCAKQTVKLLLLVPWPDEFGRDHAGWDRGHDLIPGARVARDAINNRTDLLADYTIELIEAGHEACGLTENSLGLRNVVHYASNTAAVLGLFCSTNTIQLSPIAGHRNIGLVQLSASNSPFFHSYPMQFPHQWRFLVSASIYAHMMLHLMEKFNWTKIGIIQDVEDFFFSEIANDLLRNLNVSQIAYNGLLFKLENSFYRDALENIQSSGAKIIFISATSSQISKLLCMAGDIGLTYPDYMWIVIDKQLSYLESNRPDTCKEETLLKSLHGSVMTFFRLEPQNATQLLGTGYSYAVYRTEYFKQLKAVSKEYTGSENTLQGDLQYASLAHDQVWAFAFALNRSLPKLEQQNLSITDTALGYSETQETLESELARTDFIGASGRIKFDYKEVSTSINLFQISNSQEQLIGGCEGLNSFIIDHCTIDPVLPIPSSEFEVRSRTYPLEWTIFMSLGLAVTTIIVTATLVLMCRFRERPEIKATGFWLSILQLCGLYLFCVSMLVSMVYRSSSKTEELKYTCPINVFIITNGFNLIILTVFVKLYRVFQIFNNRRLKDLGWKLSNQFLIVCVILFSTVPIFLLVTWFVIDEYTLGEIRTNHFDGTDRHITSISQCVTRRNLEIYQVILLYSYLLIFMSFNIYLAFRTRRIYGNFKDTKKISLLMVMLLVGTALLVGGVSLLSTYRLDYYLSVMYYCFFQLIVYSCLCCLFVPKLWWLKTKVLNFMYNATMSQQCNI